jgi:hypothetical protein
VLLELEDAGVVVVEGVVPPHGRVDSQDCAVDLDFCQIKQIKIFPR